jgi:hypothetical protein
MMMQLNHEGEGDGGVSVGFERIILTAVESQGETYLRFK